MRHQKAGRHLNMSTSHREAMFRNMVTSLFRKRRIETTDARAKELRMLAEKLITTAKRGDLHARRLVMRTITDAEVVRELFDTIAPTYANRNGGYTRILKAGRRRGDNAPLSLIELVDLEPKIEELEEKVEKKKKKKEERKRAEEEAAARAGTPTESAPAEKG
ncbi:MAG: 50S ribosomal protein L17 [Candidatus Eisenbacteria bacterium]|nr:50S ribosomal protein L17 [Candidatus Eisenbacteria bacterium]